MNPSQQGSKMINQRKTKIIFALLVSSIFFLQSCATIGRGISQKIPVTSNPLGAKISVDGEERGYIPLQLKLKRKKSHIIRIDKQGYNPIEIKIIPETTKNVGISILENFPWAFIGAFGGATVTSAFIGVESGFPTTEGILVRTLPGFFLGWAMAVFIDHKSGAIHTLYPKELNATLSKIKGELQPKVFIIDTKQFQNIKWIRIKCEDIDKEEIIEMH